MRADPGSPPFSAERNGAFYGQSASPLLRPVFLDGGTGLCLCRLPLFVGQEAANRKRQDPGGLGPDQRGREHLYAQGIPRACQVCRCGRGRHSHPSAFPNLERQYPRQRLHGCRLPDRYGSFGHCRKNRHFGGDPFQLTVGGGRSERDQARLSGRIPRRRRYGLAGCGLFPSGSLGGSAGDGECVHSAGLLFWRQLAGAVRQSRRRDLYQNGGYFRRPDRQGGTRHP